MNLRPSESLHSMTTFALIHGSGDGGWAWHLVQRALSERGHTALAPDLPTVREETTWDDCVDVLVTALAGAGDPVGDSVGDVVVVGHSAGGFLVPLAAQRLGAVLQVYVAGMVPSPGENANQWFEHTGWRQAVAERARADGGLTGNPDPMIAFYHDVPPRLAHQALARERPTGVRLGQVPWPLPALPKIEARYIVTTQDRFIPPSVQRTSAARRLGITAPDELRAGHCAPLSRPTQLAALLAGYVQRAEPR